MDWFRRSGGTHTTSQTSPQHCGSSSLLVIQGHCSIMATSKWRVTHSKILIRQGRKRASPGDQPGHRLAFTKNDDEPTLFTSVRNEADRVESV